MTCPLCGEIEDFCLCNPDIPCLDCPDVNRCDECMENSCRAIQEWYLRED